MKDISITLWEVLGDIPINDREEIEKPFLHFKIGTPRENIWHWFESTFNLSVSIDLMKLEVTA
jgi:hypothetical protein